MARAGFQRSVHRVLGVADRALRIAREAIVHPSVGPSRTEPSRHGEGLLGAGRFAAGCPGLALGVVRVGEIRRGETGVTGRLQRSLSLAAL